MKEKLQSRIALFAENAHRLKGKFIWQGIMLKRLSALIFTARGRTMDYRAVQDSYDMIRERTGWFSSFRGNSAMTVATLLALHGDRRGQLNNTLTVYDMMKAHKFRSSDYLVVAAYQIADNTERDKYDQTVERSKIFYDGMKSEHRFITGQNDYIYAAMMGLSDMEPQSGLRRIEDLYRFLIAEFRPADSVQALSQILALGGESRDITGRVVGLSDKFRLFKMRMDKEYTLPSLGVLALLPADDDAIVENVAGTFEHLRETNGFGRWSVTNQELLLLSSALVAYEYAGELKNGIMTGALSTGVTNIIIAQQTAIAVAAAASASAVASSVT